jgi:nitrogen fixation NifU-like protein
MSWQRNEQAAASRSEAPTEDLSREIILDHYQNPRNHGRLPNPTLANRGHNPLCGDEIELSLAIEPTSERIFEIAFTGRGCSISQASASMMTEVVKGQRLDDAEAAVSRFTERMSSREPPPRELEDELDALQGVKRYPARVKCALLPWTTLRESVNLYRHREPVAAGSQDEFDCADAP